MFPLSEVDKSSFEIMKKKVFVSKLNESNNKFSPILKSLYHYFK